MFKPVFSFTFIVSFVLCLSNLANAAISVSMSSPINGSVQSGNIVLSVQVKSSQSVKQVTFYRDNWIAVGNDTIAPYSITINSSLLTNGSHQFFAVATDSAGVNAASGVIATSISNAVADTTAPTLRMTAPLANSVLSGSSVVVSAEASDNISVTKVVFYRDNYIELGTDTTSPFQILADSKLLSDGNHNFFAIAFDLAGNKSTPTAVVAQVLNAVAEPVVIAPTPVAAVATLTMMKPVVSIGSVALAASASNISSVAKVTFFRDAWIEVGVDTTSPYSLSFSTIGLTGGAHNFFAVATTSAGAGIASGIETVSILQATDPVVVAPAPAPAAPQPAICTPINPISLSGFDALPAVQSAQIKSGPFTGGYTVEKNDSRLNWYFANIALLGFVDRIPNDVKNYMNLYLRSTNPNFSIKDIFFKIEATGVNFSAPQYEANGVGQFSDSDDSYAATILSLAARYYQVTCDRAYFDSIVPGKDYTVLQALKNIATNNLVNSLWPNGLIHVFQSAPVYYIAYTEDNVEAYRGLVDFADMLRAFGDGSAGTYQTTADKVQVAMQNILFMNNLYSGAVALNKPGYAYFWGNGLSFTAPAEPLGSPVKFYPDAVTQIFPQAYRMNMPQSQYDAGWSFLDSTFPLYTTNAYENDPWVLIGLAAALAGKNDLAIKMQTKAENSYRTGIPVPINNWSFHRRISLKLQTGQTY